MADKVYLKCSAKARTTQYGEVIHVGIKATELAEFVQQHTNERGYVNLTISARREVGQYGDTHSIYLDAYEPKHSVGASDGVAERRPSFKPVKATATTSASSYLGPSPFDEDPPF